MQNIDSTYTNATLSSRNVVENALALQRTSHIHSPPKKFENVLPVWVLFNYLDSTCLHKFTSVNKKYLAYKKYILKILLTRQDKDLGECLKNPYFNLNVIDYKIIFLQMKSLNIPFSDPNLVIMASQKGYAEVVNLFVAYHSCHINVQDNEGFSALTHAIRLGHAQIVRTLLKGGAMQGVCWDFNYWLTTGIPPGTVLMMATKYGHVDVIRALLEFKADIRATDFNRRTALMQAVSETFPGTPSYTNNILQYYSINVIPQLIKTSGHFGLTLKFIEPHIQEFESSDQATRMEIVRDAAWKGYQEILNVFLEFKPDLEMDDREGKTALMLAAIQGNIEIVQWLLTHNANVLARDHKGNSVFACILSRTWIIKWKEIGNLLLKHGAHIDAPDNQSMTPLMNLVRGNYKDPYPGVLETLLEWGASTNAIDCNGYTPLMHAIEKGEVAAIKTLLKAPSPPNLKAMGYNKKTALMIAQERGNQDIIDLLNNVSNASNASFNDSQITNVPQTVPQEHGPRKRLRDVKEEERGEGGTNGIGKMKE